MNFDGIESRLVADLQRSLGRGVAVRAGPEVTLALGGMEPTVFVHAARFDDAGGVTAEGAHISRRPVRDGRRSGIAEERPGRISVEVVCIAAAYKTVKELSTTIAPVSLLALTRERQVLVGDSGKGAVRLKFSDFTASIASAETCVRVENDLRYHRGQLRLRLDGFLHVWITTSGGVKPVEPRPVAPKPVEKPRGRKKTRKKRSTD